MAQTYLQRVGATAARAIPLPGITQGEAFTLVLYLGSRAVGYDMLGQSLPRAGPALDLTGASVLLTARRVPCVDPYYTRSYPGLWYDRNPYGYVGETLFKLPGSILVAADGKVSFDITGTVSGLGLGLYLIEPRATLAGGFIVVPAGLSMQIGERL